MKSVHIFLVSIASLLTLHGAVARTAHKSKNEDRYMTAENDISNGAPTLPIEGGYKESEDPPSQLSNDEIRKFYGLGDTSDTESGYATGAPYYYYAYNPRVIYDPKSPFYVGNDYDLTNPFPAAYAGADFYNDQDENVPEGTIISESNGTPDNPEPPQEEEVSVQPEEPTVPEDVATPEQDPVDEEQEPEPEESRAEFPWVNRETNGDFFNNYMMGIPAQLQSFPMFNPEYYQPDYAEYERIAAENERKREELEAQGLDANTVDNPKNFPRGGRMKRELAKMLHLRDKTVDGSAHLGGKAIHGKSENVVLNADCRGGYYDGRRPDPRNVTPGNVGNGVADAAGTAQDAAGRAAGAAGDAANAASDAANAATDAVNNLRLANGRRNGRRNDRRNGGRDDRRERRREQRREGRRNGRGGGRGEGRRNGRRNNRNNGDDAE